MRYEARTHKPLRGGRAYRQSEVFKDRICERDNHTCQLCGQTGSIVDHIKPWRVSHNSTPSNLRVLCHKCNLATRRERYDANPFTTLELWYKYIKNELVKGYSSQDVTV